MNRERKQPLFMDTMEVARGRKLTPAAKLVLAYLAYRQGHHESCWPGLGAIIGDLGLSRQCVLDAIDRLCASGLVEKTPGRPGRGHSHHYSVVLDKRSTERAFSDTEKGLPNRPFDTEKRSIPHTEKVYSVDQNHSEAFNKSISSPNPRTKPRKRKACRGHEYTPAFEQFWAAYPKKVGKFNAFEVWTALDPTPELVERIVAAVGVYMRTEQWVRSLAEDGGQYIPHAATFLNQHRYDDTPPTRPEPQPGDPDWLPTEDEVDAVLAKVRGR